VLLTLLQLNSRFSIVSSCVRMGVQASVGGVIVDKPRRPQVARPWKTQQTQQTKFHAPKMADARHTHSRDSVFRKRG
jgi:predicted ATPase